MRVWISLRPRTLLSRERLHKATWPWEYRKWQIWRKRARASTGITTTTNRLAYRLANLASKGQLPCLRWLKCWGKPLLQRTDRELIPWAWPVSRIQWGCIFPRLGARRVRASQPSLLSSTLSSRRRSITPSWKSYSSAQTAMKLHSRNISSKCNGLHCRLSKETERWVLSNACDHWWQHDRCQSH